MKELPTLIQQFPISGEKFVYEIPQLLVLANDAIKPLFVHTPSTILTLSKLPEVPLELTTVTRLVPPTSTLSTLFALILSTWPLPLVWTHLLEEFHLTINPNSEELVVLATSTVNATWLSLCNPFASLLEPTPALAESAMPILTAWLLLEKTSQEELIAKRMDLASPAHLMLIVVPWTEALALLINLFATLELEFAKISLSAPPTLAALLALTA